MGQYEKIHVYLFLISINQVKAQLTQVAVPEWQELFNGRDLTGWQIKIRGYDLTDNLDITFRVEAGKM
ncbi:MAG: hypothetical protein ABIR66_03780 [Saprospiraceae bacterium]